MATWEYVEWLLFWILETSLFEFEWDNGNIFKNSQKHGVSIEEIEAVFRSGYALPLGIQITPIVSEQRLGLVGPTINGRLLHIAFVFRNGKIRVISARPAQRRERRKYEEDLRKILKRV